MKKSMYRFFTLAMLVGLGVGLPSCKEDEPPVPPKLSFEVDELTAKESDREVEIKLILDKAATTDIDIEYSISGTANEETKIGTSGNPDYAITSDYLELEIKAGETEGIITLEFFSDALIEDEETIEISIEDVTEGIELTRDDEINITVQQEDGLIAVLEWPSETPTGKADMDLLVRVGANTVTWDGILLGSSQSSFQSGEYVFIPLALEFAAYGLSYVYYEGNLDPLDFTVTFIDLVDGAVEPEAQQQVFDGQYTLANINAWEDPNTTLVVQTFTKSGDQFTNFSTITKPEAGSRVPSRTIPILDHLMKTISKR